MVKIAAISGSLRKNSYNTMLLHAAKDLAPEGVIIEIESIIGIPLYDGDREEHSGIPVAVADLGAKIAEAHALLIATPEYNHSIPGVLKNAIDWLSRPTADPVHMFYGKPVAIMGASNGLGGTRTSQAAWMPVLHAIGVRPWFGRQVYVSNASHAFDAQGKLIDERIRDLLTDFVREFAVFAAEERG